MRHQGHWNPLSESPPKLLAVPDLAAAAAAAVIPEKTILGSQPQITCKAIVMMILGMMLMLTMVAIKVPRTVTMQVPPWLLLVCGHWQCA